MNDEAISAIRYLIDNNLRITDDENAEMHDLLDRIADAQRNIATLTEELDELIARTVSRWYVKDDT